MVLAFVPSVWGEEATPAPSPQVSPTPDPEVDIRAPGSYKAKKYYLFPLEVPAYVLRGATYPLHELTKLAERHKVIERAADYFLRNDFIIFPIFQVGGGDGLGGGLGLRARDVFHSGYNIGADFTVFTDFDMRAGLKLSSPDYYVANRPFRYNFSARFREKNDQNFFGIGDDTSRADESDYGFNRVRTGMEFEYQVLPSLTLSMPAQFLTARARADDDGDKPSVEQVFPPSELVAFRDRTNYLVFGLQVAHDTRDSEDVPSRGGYRSISFSRFQGLGGTNEFSFNEIELDIRQYFRLWTPRHVLVVRNDWVFQFDPGSGGIPFNLVNTLDYQSPLRGFRSGRWKDSASVLFNFEYRFPIWDYIDGGVFVDTGKVFNGLTDFSFDHWRYSVGGGIRIIARDHVLLRFGVGYGGEGALIFFRFGEVL